MSDLLTQARQRIDTRRKAYADSKNHALAVVAKESLDDADLMQRLVDEITRLEDEIEDMAYDASYNGGEA